MRRVGGDEQHGLAVAGDLDGERAGGGRLADAAFAADEDPAERALGDDRFEAGREGRVGVGVDEGGVGHGFFLCVCVCVCVYCVELGGVEEVVFWILFLYSGLFWWWMEDVSGLLAVLGGGIAQH